MTFQICASWRQHPGLLSAPCKRKLLQHPPHAVSSSNQPQFGNPHFQPRPDTLPFGRRVGEVIADKYRVRRLLGEGSHGMTYAADAGPSRLVAVKELSIHRLQGWKQFDLFEREAQVLSGLQHPNIPRYIEYLEVGGSFFLVQELADGRTIQDLVSSGTRFREQEVERVAREVLGVLQHLKERKPPIVHRDIKPENLMLKGGTADGAALMIDFGGVGAAVAPGGFGSTIIGTYGYMAPEQFHGLATTESDLYSLGAVLLFILTGRPPHTFPVARLRLDFERSLHCGVRLRAVVRGLLEPLVEDRMSAEEALSILSGDMDDDAIEAMYLHRPSPTSGSAPARPPAWTNPYGGLPTIPFTPATSAAPPSLGAPLPGATRDAAGAAREASEHGKGKSDSDEEDGQAGPDLPNPFEFGWPRMRPTIRQKELDSMFAMFNSRPQPPPKHARSAQLCRPWREAPTEQPAGSGVRLSKGRTTLTISIPAVGFQEESGQLLTASVLAKVGVGLLASGMMLMGGPFACLIMAPMWVAADSAANSAAAEASGSVSGYLEQVLVLRPKEWEFHQHVPKLPSGTPLFDGTRDMVATGAIRRLAGARVTGVDVNARATVIELQQSDGTIFRIGERLSTLEQEWLVGRVNSFLEASAGPGAVTVDND